MKFLIVSFVLVAVVSADRIRPVQDYPAGAFPYPRILHQTYELKPGQSYIYSYGTENGISANQEGVYHYTGPNGKPILHAKGGYQFTTPDGYLVSVTYTAGPGGYYPHVTVQYRGNQIKPIPYPHNPYYPSNPDIWGFNGPRTSPPMEEQAGTPIASKSTA